MSRLGLRSAALLLVVGAASGCGTKAPATTGVTVTATFPSAIDQLELTVTAGATVVVGPKRRPEPAGSTLVSPQSVSIFLPDLLAGQDVTCSVTGLSGGHAALSGSAPAKLALNRLVTVAVDLTPLEGDAGAGDADSGDDADVAPNDGAPNDDASADAPPTSDAADGGDDVPPGLKPNGSSCLSGGECDSTACVDGVCCESACTGTCESCNQKGKEGTCTPVPTGTPATAECVNQGVASCGFDGTCDGNGACRHYAAGSPCKAASCQTSMFMPASACDGQGKCVAANAVDCAPYLCDASGGAPACRTTCSSTVGCVSPAVCTSASCGPKVLKPAGAGCVAAGDCLSNRCHDGVCCTTACTTACVSCNQAGFEGTCRSVAAGKPDPHAVCKDAGAAGCKQDGLCNGAGACALYPATTTCQMGACAGRFLGGARHCDGAGNCAAAVVSDCAPYRCDPAKLACFTSCTSNAMCSTQPRRCNDGGCQP